ncbi:MAG TPA: DUF779 domain-containing protein [Microscillaceae bacterium]|nr:DUF779 domain-containing protein [Microscillaceae bacterium]
MVERVIVTPEAAEVIGQLKIQHGELMFHQSGGCCDGSSPMCFPIDELMLDDNDVFLGEIEQCAFYMSKDQFDYWQHTQLIINVTKGRGASFSLEIPLGLRFITESRVYSENESLDLRPISLGKQ